MYIYNTLILNTTVEPNQIPIISFYLLKSTYERYLRCGWRHHGVHHGNDRSPALPRYASPQANKPQSTLPLLSTAERLTAPRTTRLSPAHPRRDASPCRPSHVLFLSPSPGATQLFCPFLFRDLVPFSSVPDSPLRDMPFEVPIARFGSPAVPGIICPKRQPRSDATFVMLL